eukprot:maker-scaffold_25-snap-gene-1.40-mRNA-1 protein AED:0.43 eAED:0.44 QI:0/0/0/1/1/1/3/0/164
MPKDTALHKAAHQGETSTVEELIKSGEIDVNAKGAQDRTALHRACGGNHIECIDLLISLGANKDQADKAGRTPLHWAAIGGHIEAVQSLLKLNVKLNGKTSSGQTPLHSAVDGDKIEIVKLLIGCRRSKTAEALAKEKKAKETAKMIHYRKVDVSKEGGACGIS